MKVKDIKNIGLVGGGLIGASFALAFSLGGLNAHIYTRSKETLDASEEIIKNSLDELIKLGVKKEDEKDEILKRISYTNNLEEAIKDADYIQESLKEDYDIKRKVLADVEKIISPEIPIGSSTSGLKATEIARDMKHPERFFVAHPWNPPHLIPLIELCKGEKTDDKYIYLAKELFEKIKKTPIILEKEVLGFVGNRIQAAVFREVLSLVLNGVVSMEDADKAVTFGPGIRWGIMGPSLILELGGGSEGIAGFMKNIGPSMELWLEDLADWDKLPISPEEIGEITAQELRNRDEKLGNNRKSLGEYRTKMLVEFLKLHGKI
ncbi:3-hydroxyacyl-CoA dehydrogenase family protein [Peptoniphilus sp. MSJ-1]|uniref:L-gulonate 3-dehydrogenase n=1 Tax=Peptoniphilus ovalis TaxID=2841503 RepID=A0ABS6FDQ8_9FIRM|nr:3-hydroxyacyl-CoA dehydrogenase NAD-binding domain-containing protein [Peptoniphilus ovalis]MBU5668318.1 3-hydroxyacyl-CoA dehydrogenase family protein [Peptoniphilus ovalis]